MKSRRRHELQQNVLDAELGKTIEFFKKHGSKIFGLLLVAALIYLGVTLYRRQSSGAQQQLQTDYNQAVAKSMDRRVTPDEMLAMFKGIADRGDDNQIVAMSCVYVGDLYASKILSAESESQRQEIARQATIYYRRVIRDFPERRLPVAKAHFGLAKLAETTRDLETARREYQAVMDTGLVKYPVVHEADKARKRLEWIAAPVPMATTLPSQPTTEPATKPASAPATQPRSAPAARPAPATQPAGAGQ